MLSHNAVWQLPCPLPLLKKLKNFLQWHWRHYYKSNDKSWTATEFLFPWQNSWRLEIVLKAANRWLVPAFLLLRYWSRHLVWILRSSFFTLLHRRRSSWAAVMMGKNKKWSSCSCAKLKPKKSNEKLCAKSSIRTLKAEIRSWDAKDHEIMCDKIGLLTSESI